MCLCLLPVASSAVYRAAHSTPAPGLVATHTQSTEGSENLFDPTDPNGKFKLNMRVPYDKMVLRLILDEAGKRVGFHVDQMEYTPLSGARVLLHVIHRLTKKLDASVVKALGLLEESLDAHDRMLLHHSIAGSIEVQRAVVVLACPALYANGFTPGLQVHRSAGGTWHAPDRGVITLRVKYDRQPAKRWDALKGSSFTALLRVRQGCGEG